MARKRPTPDEIDYFLKKIRKWSELGFDTRGLEDLLRSDLDEFKKRKSEVLKGQLGGGTDGDISTSRSVPIPGSSLKNAGHRDISDKGRGSAVARSPEYTIKSRVKKVAVISLQKEQGEKPKDPSPRKEPLKEKASTKNAHVKEPKVSTVSPVSGSVPEDVILIGSPRGKGRSSGTSDGVIVLDNSEEPALEKGYNYYDIPPTVEEEERDSSHRPTGKKKSKKRRRGDDDDDSRTKDTVIALVITVILVLAGLAILYPDSWKNVFDWTEGNGGNGNPDILVLIDSPKDGSYFSSGESIEFQATVVNANEADVQHREWNLGDGELSSKAKPSHHYTVRSNTTFKIIYTIQVDDSIYNSSVSIHIQPIVVKLSEKRKGQSASYDVQSNIIIMDPEGIESFGQEDNEIRLTEMDVQGQGDQTLANEIPGSMIDDGFLTMHDTYRRDMNMSLDLYGNATLEYYNQAGTFSENTRLSGDLMFHTSNYFDLSSGWPIKNAMDLDVELYTDLDQNTPYRIRDSMINYQDLSGNYLNPDITSLRANLTFRLGDGEPGGIGGLHYMWNIDDVDSVGGMPALKVDIDLNKDEIRSAFGIREHSISVWISNGMAFPVKYSIFIVQEQDGTQITFDLIGVLKPNGYQQGSSSISSLNCDQQHNQTSHHAKRWDDNQGELAGEFVQMDLFPVSGNISGDMSGFTIEEAMDIIDDRSDYKNFIFSHPNAFVVDSYFNISDGTSMWNITLGESGSDKGLRFHVKGQSVEAFQNVDVGEIDIYPFEVGEIVTFGGAQKIFRQQEMIKNIFFSKGGIGGPNIDSGVTGMGASSDIPSLSLESIYAGSGRDRDMGYYLSSADSDSDEDTQYLAVLNAATGQILYHLEHIVTAPSLELSDILT